MKIFAIILVIALLAMNLYLFSIFIFKHEQAAIQKTLNDFKNQPHKCEFTLGGVIHQYPNCIILEK